MTIPGVLRGFKVVLPFLPRHVDGDVAGMVDLGVRDSREAGIPAAHGSGFDR